MLKAFVEKIVSLADPVVYNLDGENYSSQPLHHIKESAPAPREIEVTGLDSICKLIQNELNSKTPTVYIRVASYRRVDVFTSFADAEFTRHYLYRANADVPGMNDGWRDHERAVIELRSLFLPGTGVDYLLDLLSRVSSESKVSSADNGVTQTVEATQGVALKANIAVRPRVQLAPFRTFLEVEQPASEFLVRVNAHGQIGLFEADGGVWKLEAKANIVKYFEERLSDLIDAGQVVVMM